MEIYVGEICSATSVLIVHIRLTITRHLNICNWGTVSY